MVISVEISSLEVRALRKNYFRTKQNKINVLLKLGAGVAINEILCSERGLFYFACYVNCSEPGNELGLSLT